MQDVHLHLVVAQLLQRLLDGLDRALHVGLDNQVQVLQLTLVDVIKQVIQRYLGGSGAGSAHLFTALLRYLTAQAVIRHGHHIVARFRHLGEARDFNRHGGTGFLYALAAIVEHRAHAAGGHTGDNVIAHMKRTVLKQHRSQRAAVLIQLGLDDHAARHAVGIGAKLHHVGLQQNHFQQVVHALAGQSADGGHDGIATPLFGHQVVRGQILLYAVRISAFLIHLIDGNNDRHASRAGMVDGFNSLGHHAIIGGNHQHSDIRRLSAAGAHGSEGLMAGGIQESNGAAIEVDGIRADMLRNAARLARGDVGLADIVQQRGLAVVNVTHDGDDRRTGLQLIFGILRARFLSQRILSRAIELHFKLYAKLGADQRSGIEIQLTVDVGHDTEQEQLFEDFTSGLADALSQILDRDVLGRHISLVDMDGRHHLLGGRLLLAGARALAAAYHLVVHAAVHIGAFLGQLLAALGHALGIMLADILLLVRIVIAYALLFNHRRKLGTARSAITLLRTLTHAARTRAALAGTRRALTLRTGTTLPGTRREVALTLRTRGKAALTLRARTTLAGARRIAALLTLCEDTGGLAGA